MRAALLAIMLILVGASNSLHAAPDPKTDPWDNSNPFAMPGGNNTKRILPYAFEQYAPSGDFLATWGFGSAGQPPDASAVDSIIIGLVRASSGTTALSRSIWNFAISLVIFGTMLSGFITFKAISAGKETPGLGAMKWIGKSMFAIILVNYVAASIPVTLIKICDQISGVTSSGSGGFVGADKSPNAIEVVGERIINTYQARYISWRNEVALRVYNLFKDKSDPRYIAIRDALASSSQDAGAAFQAARGKIPAIVADKSQPSDMISQALSDVGKEAIGTALTATNEKLKQAMLESKTEGSIEGAILAAGSIDLSGLAYPVKIIRMAVYISVVIIALSIWSMPIAILMWAGIFSLPSQWGMSNILYSGVKGIFTIIITMLLVMTYVSGTLTTEKEGNKSATKKLTGWLASIPFVGDTANKFINVGYILNGTTPDLIIASALILSAPAQAAGIVKGANGIAEHANKSMMAGGSARGMPQAFGNYSGTNASGTNRGIGANSGGAGSVSLASFQQNMSPGKSS